MTIMRYRLGCYDWNGSLANDFEIGYGCLVAIFETFSPNLRAPDKDQWRKEHANTSFFEFYYRNGIPRSVTVDDMRAVWVRHYDFLAATGELSLSQGAEQVLTFCRARETKNVIISSSIDDVGRYLRERNVSHFFSNVKVKVKDKAAALRETAEECAVAPQEAFYIDDTCDGLLHAKGVGMTTFGFTQGFNCEDAIRSANPDHVVHSFHEVLEILAA